MDGCLAGLFIAGKIKFFNAYRKFITFDDERIMESFIKSERHDAEKAMAEQLIRKGKMRPS